MILSPGGLPQLPLSDRGVADEENGELCLSSGWEREQVSHEVRPGGKQDGGVRVCVWGALTQGGFLPWIPVSPSFPLESHIA